MIRRMHGVLLHEIGNQRNPRGGGGGAWLHGLAQWLTASVPQEGLQRITCVLAAAHG